MNRRFIDVFLYSYVVRTEKGDEVFAVYERHFLR